MRARYVAALGVVLLFGCLAVCLFSGCGGGQSLMAPTDASARTITSTDDFTFLPPIGTDKELDSFDAEANPTVRVVKDGATVVDFPPDDGTGQSDTVRLN